MSRTKDALSRRTESLIRAVDHSPGENLYDRLSHLVDDDALPLRMRLDALRHLSGYLHARVRLSDAAKRRIEGILA